MNLVDTINKRIRTEKVQMKINSNSLDKKISDLNSNDIIIERTTLNNPLNKITNIVKDIQQDSENIQEILKNPQIDLKDIDKFINQLKKYQNEIKHTISNNSMSNNINFK